ncbi:MAG: mandelate racemase/muconate lactonizing enzyme family protein [Candidatus Binatia bacterium]
MTMTAGSPVRPTGRIVDIGVLRKPIALRRPIVGAKGPVTTRSVRLLHLTSDDDIAGLGEASTVDWLATAAGSAATMAPLLRALGDRIRSDRPTAEDLLLWTMDDSRPAALRSALQTALLDIEARRRGVGVAAMLAAGQREPASSIPLCALLGEGDADNMAREASRLVVRGLTCFKVKVGRPDLALDVARVLAVRGAIGQTAELRLDANGAWSVDQAARALEAFAVARPQLVEEPLRDAASVAAMDAAGLVALDESVRDEADLGRAISGGGFSVLVLKLERVGGPLAALAMAAQAARAGIQVVFTDSIESTVGRSATVHVAAAVTALASAAPRAIGLGGLALLEEDVSRDEATGGTVAVRSPGLGINIEALLAGKAG